MTYREKHHDWKVTLVWITAGDKIAASPDFLCFSSLTASIRELDKELLCNSIFIFSPQHTPSSQEISDLEDLGGSKAQILLLGTNTSDLASLPFLPEEKPLEIRHRVLQQLDLHRQMILIHELHRVRKLATLQAKASTAILAAHWVHGICCLLNFPFHIHTALIRDCLQQPHDRQRATPLEKSVLDCVGIIAQHHLQDLDQFWSDYKELTQSLDFHNRARLKEAIQECVGRKGWAQGA